MAERINFSAQILQSMGVTLWKAQVEVQKIIGYASTLFDRSRREAQTVACYRPRNEVIRLGNEDILTAVELLPGWELPLSELWSFQRS